MAVDQFSGISGSMAVTRSTIMAMASIRPGPHVVGVTRVRVRYSCTSAASLSKRLRKLAFASAARRPQPRRQTVKFRRIGQSRLQRIVEA